LDLVRRLVEDEDEPHDPWAATIDYINKYRDGKLPTRRLTADAEKEEETEESEELLPQNDRGLQEKVFKGFMKECLFTVRFCFAYGRLVPKQDPHSHVSFRL
jgi:hypothetical protein